MPQELDYTFVRGSERRFGYTFQDTFDNYTGEIIDDPLR